MFDKKFYNLILTRYYASTYFVPFYARQAFPCFDEPMYKATFHLTIRHHQNFSAISNTKVQSRSYRSLDKRVETFFEKTPKMSTYLLAFVISEFENVTNEAQNFSIYARPPTLEQASLVTNYSKAILGAMENFIEVPFAISKLDQVAVPKFAFGINGMEHWGLITYA